MKTDIEKLSRKMPYTEPTDDFFSKMQANVISQTVAKQPLAVKKEAKVFSLNFSWMAAAAVVLIGGLTAFFSLNNDPEVSMAQQAPIVDSVYEVEKPLQNTSTDMMAKNDNVIPQTQTLKTEQKNATANAATSIDNNSKVNAMADRQDYTAKNTPKSDLDVEKVLAAFTPDQLKDIDRNSEQDVYLDLYN
jgi:hypothetical protein